MTISSPNLLLLSYWETLDCPFGNDYYPIIIKFLFSPDVLSNREPRVIHNHKFKADWLLFSRSVDPLVPTSFLDNHIAMYTAFTKVVISAASQSILKYVTHQNVRSSPMWWNKDCTKAVNDRTNCFCFFRHSRSLTDFLSYKNQCAVTCKVLKQSKFSSWKDYTGTLHSNTSIGRFWNTSKKFRWCIFPITIATNEDWFENFCSKVASSCVPMYNEVTLSSNLDCSNQNQSLVKPFFSSELIYAINSRKSLVADLDSIPPLHTKNLPESTINVLLTILNNLFSNTTIPDNFMKKCHTNFFLSNFSTRSNEYQ